MGVARARYLGYAQDLSASGLFVQTTRPRQPGTRIEFRLHLPGSGTEPVGCVGEVVWTRGYGGRLGPAPGMGIRFLELDARAFDTLARLCRSSSS